MRATRATFPDRGARTGLLMLVMLLCAACGWIGGSSKPSWIDGQSAQFPSTQYLVGVGQADSRPQATEQAYAAVSRIFKAEITAQAKDWESYLVVESRGQTSTERKLVLDNVTRVTTEKVLENVQVLDIWFDQKTRQYYALAGMNRAQAESAMLERLADLDRSIQTDVMEARQTQDKLSHVRHLKRAAKNLVLREAYNTDLRTIRLNGQGHPAAYRVAELTAELERYLAANVGMAVEVAGEQAEPLERALIEGLTREGFSVVGHGAESAQAALLITATVRTWPIEVPDPHFRYVRWCADAVIEEVSSRRVIGAMSKGGKEGHVTEREASAKAVRVMQQEFSSDLAHAVAAHLYGERELSVTPPASGCPSEAAQSPLSR